MANLLIKDINGKIFKTMPYYRFESSSLDEKRMLYDMKKSGYLFFCDCSKEKELIELTMGKLEDTYYIRNLQDGGKKHAHNCNLNREYTGSNGYETGWTESDSGILYVNLDAEAFGKKTKKSTKSHIDTDEMKELHSYSNSRTRKGAVTLFGLTIKLNLMAWGKFYENHSRFPNKIYEHTAQAYGVANHIRINKEDSLNRIWYEKSKLYNLDKGKLLFGYFPILFINNKGNANKVFTVKSYYPNKESATVNDETHEILCQDELYKEACISAMISDDRSLEGKTDGRYGEDDVQFPYMASGFIKKTRGGKPEFVSLSFLPVTKNYLYCESSYEKRVYEELVNLGIPFKKGNKPIPEYNGYVPDIIFTEREKDMFGEVFGMEGNEDYNLKKAKKIKIAQDCKDEYDFWYWDITKSKEPPAYDKPAF